MNLCLRQNIIAVVNKIHNKHIYYTNIHIKALNLITNILKIIYNENGKVKNKIPTYSKLKLILLIIS